MTYTHLGNNFYIYRTIDGDNISEIPISNNAVAIDISTGLISNYITDSWKSVNFGAQSDQLMMSVTRQVAFTNIGTSYVDVFGSLYQGFPHGLDTKGFTKMGVVILWNKNSGTGRHDMRLVNIADTTQVFASTESRTVANSGADGLVNGVTKDYGVVIPPIFTNWVGEVKLQAKSTVASDDPIFDAFLLYLRR